MKPYWKWLSLNSVAAPASLFFVSYLILFQPALTYWENHHYMVVKFNTILWDLIPISIILYLLLALPGVGLRKKWKRYYTAILGALAFSAWFSGLFTSSNGVLDGTSFSLTTGYFSYIQLFILIVISVVFAVVAYHKSEMVSAFQLFSAVIFLAFVGWVSFVGGQNNNYKDSEYSKSELFMFSKQKNVLLILLDSFQSDFFQEILNKEPALASELSGFIYYPNATSTAPTTILSIPNIHSGRVYQLGEKISDFYKQGVETHSFIHEMQEHGYHALMVWPYLHYAPPKVSRINPNTLLSVEEGAWINSETRKLLDYALFKALPHMAKKNIYNNGLWLFSKHSLPKQILSNLTLDALASNIQVNSQSPTVKFLHLFNAHAPAILNESCSNNNPIPTWNYANALNQDFCALKHVVKLLHALKEHQIYDNTLIVIVADHGTGLTKQGDDNYLGALANPLFLFKPFNYQQPFQTSTQLQYLGDIKNLICKETKACSDSETNSALTFAKPGIVFNNYSWNSMHKDILRKDVVPIIQYTIHGPPRLSSSWTKRILQSLDYVSELSFESLEFEKYSGKGWSEQEPGLRWAIGKKAALYLPLKRHQDAQIALTAMTHEKNTHEKLSVWANHQFIGAYTIVDGQNAQIRFTIPKALIHKELTLIEFHFSQWNKVSKEDKRPLAVAFLKSLRIEQQG